MTEFLFVLSNKPTNTKKTENDWEIGFTNKTWLVKTIWIKKPFSLNKTKVYLLWITVAAGNFYKIVPYSKVTFERLATLDWNMC